MIWMCLEMKLFKKKYMVYPRVLSTNYNLLYKTIEQYNKDINKFIKNNKQKEKYCFFILIN